MNKGNEKLFYQCFSLGQHKYLESLGFKSEFKAKHIHTDRVFWLYVYDKQEKLNNALEEWSRNNPKKEN